MNYKQKGKNSKYPDSISVWFLKDKHNIPYWLTESAAILGFDEFDDYPILDIRGNSIQRSDGKGFLVVFTSEEDCICFGDNKIFSLTPKQLEILYKKEGEQ